MPSHLPVFVLGPVTIGGVELTGANARALVAALALAHPGTRSVEGLAEDIWGDDLPQNPRASLQTLVSRVRAVAGPEIIRSSPAGYGLDVIDLDLDQVRILVAEVERRPQDRVELLAGQAMALWDGTPGADLGSSPVAAELAEAAASLRARLDTALAAGLTAQGRDAEAVEIYAALAGANPFDEVAHERLMRSLDAAGRTSDALAVFAGLRERLRDELGASPGAGVAELNARLVRRDGERSAPRVRIGLRAAPNELIGRDADLAEVARLLRAGRAVTVLGAGGLGKTRLAQAAAAASDSPVVAFVPLASVRDDADVAAAVAGVVMTEGGSNLLSDARQRPEQRARLVATLAERPTLLVLDNCEQVVDGVAAWVSDMLGAVPSLRVLTTSRTALAIAGEAVHPLAPLGTDDGEGPAVRLFLDRARAVRPTASLPLDVVTRICAHLDGLPLAIELAAARVRTMTPAQIEERLRDRFALLTTGARSAPERHRTLEAVIAWSWELLDDEARSALARLSVLPAGFSAETAAGVLAEPVDDILDRLVSQSLLIVVDDADDVRFRMLETVREYGLARLADDGATDAAWDAVFEWMRVIASNREEDLLDPSALAETRAEHDNLLAALRRAIDHGRDSEVVLAFALLSTGWMVRGQFTEMLSLIPPALAAAQRLPWPIDARAVPLDALVITLTIGAASAQYGDGAAGLRPAVLLRRLASEPGVSPTLAAVAELAVAAASPGRLMEVIDRLRRSDDPATAVVAEFALAQFAENDGEAEVSLAAYQRAWESANTTGSAWIAAMAASGVGQLASQSGRSAEALVWLDRADAGFRALGMGQGMQEPTWMRAGALLSLGRTDESRVLFAELADRPELTPDGLDMASVGYFGLAEIARVEGQGAQAAETYRYAMGRFASALQRSSPWYLMAMAGFVSAGAVDGIVEPEEVAQWARRLRTRMLAVGRTRGMIDKPVLGSALVGVSAWALTRPGAVGVGLEMLGLAEFLGARQDLPTLRLDLHTAQAIEVAGAEATRRARDAASILSSDDRVTRARALLSDQALRM